MGGWELPATGNPVCAIMGFAGVTDADEILAPDTTWKHGSTAAVGGSLADIPRLTNAFVGTDHEIVSGYRGTARVRLGLQGMEVDAACWGWESMGVTARSMLDAEGDDQFIPYAMTFPSDDPEIADLPLLIDYIEDPGPEGTVRPVASGLQVPATLEYATWNGSGADRYPAASL